MKWKKYLPIILSFVFLAAQFTTLSHNAEFGSDHKHSGQVCDFVLHSDRSGAADAVPVFALFKPNLCESGHNIVLGEVYNAAFARHKDARAPPYFS